MTTLPPLPCQQYGAFPRHIRQGKLALASEPVGYVRRAAGGGYGQEKLERHRARCFRDVNAALREALEARPDAATTVVPDGTRTFPIVDYSSGGESVTDSGSTDSGGI